MRGIVLLAVGVLLIWVGASTSQDRTEAADADGTSRAEEASGTWADPGAGEPVSVIEPDPEEIESPGADFPETEIPADDSLAGGASADGHSAGGALDPATPTALERTVIVQEPTDTATVGPIERETYDGTADPVALPGLDTRGDELALALLGAWVSRDPSALENLLNDEQNPVAPPARDLVVGFWQALTDHPEEADRVADGLDGAEGITSSQLGLLRAAGDEGAKRTVAASAGRRDSLSRAMRMVLLLDRAEQVQQAGDDVLAAESWSEVMHLELDAPWPPNRDWLLQWAEGLARAQSGHRLDPHGAWPDEKVEVRSGDSLALIRKRVAKQSGLLASDDLIRVINGLGEGLNPIIHPGDVLRIPTDRPNVLVDLDARLIVYRHGDEAVLAWECGIGREGDDTPPGVYTIGVRQREPAYTPPGKMIPYGDKVNNPLGTRWLPWMENGVGNSYGIHGTWEPEGVGERVSQGCVRMRNEDVEVLYDLLPKGARVTVQP